MSKKQIRLIAFILAILLFANCSLSFSFSSNNIEKIINLKNKISQIFPDQIGHVEQLIGQKILQRQSKQKGFVTDNFTIQFDNLQGNILVLDKFVLIPQNVYPYPVIYKIDLQTMAIEKLLYPNVTRWMYFDNTMVLSILPSGEVAFGADREIMILDRETLKVKQMFTSSEALELVKRFHYFTDPSTLESRILVKKHSSHTISERLYELKRDANTGLYSQTFLGFSQDILYDIWFDFEMTGMNKAVSVYLNRAYVWENFNQVIDYSHDLKYALLNRQKVALSYNEQYFVMRNSVSYYYEFYHLDAKYEVELKKAILIGYNQHVRGQFTSDDKHMFVLMRTPKKLLNIAKVNVDKGQFSLVTDIDGNADNHIDFNLFTADTDRMIVLAQKGTEYVLQLRTISNLTIIHEFPLSFDFTVIDIKLIGSIEWGLTFAVTAQYLNNYYADADSKLLQFAIKEDKIVQTGVNRLVSFDYHTACSTYIVLYHLRDYNLTILDASTMKPASIKPIGVYQRVTFQKNVMTIGSLNVEYYDFSQSLDLQGVFFKELQQMAQRQHFLFPKRRLALDIATKLYYTDQITRILLDLSKLQVSSYSVFKNQEPNLYQPMYYHPLDGACDRIYYTEYSRDSARREGLKEPFWYQNPHIGFQDQCTKKSQTYALGVEDYCRTKSMFSSDKRYIFIFIQSYYKKQNVDFLLQIRSRENIDKLVFSKEFFFGSLYQERNSMDYLIGDLIDDSMLLIKSQQFFYKANIQLQDQQRNLN